MASDRLRSGRWAVLITIGITDNMRPQPLFENYLRWLHCSPVEMQIIKLSYLLDNLAELERCNGLILTGGGDVHPAYYQRPDAVSRVEEVNEKRDEFEFRVIDDAMRIGIPVLGICRGMQIFNVAMGGTLIVDLEDAGFESHRQVDAQERRHAVQATDQSLLAMAAGVAAGTINTIHHQAVDRPGHGLAISARSPDGVIEAVEWEDRDRSPFLMLVQWHPERMHDVQNPFSKNVREYFLEHVLRHTLKHKYISRPRKNHE